jgi:ATP-binding cassette, subfamily B (MDR/TAP), member 1
MSRQWPQSRESRFAAWEFFRLLFWASPQLLDIALLLTGTFFAIAGGTTYPILGTLYGKLIDDMNSGGCEGNNLEMDGVRTKVMFIAAVAVAQFVIIYLYMGCWTLFGERLVRRLRTRYLAALLRQDLAYFEKVPPGEISSRLDSDIQAIQDGASEKVAVVLTSVSYFLTAYSISFMINARLTGLMAIMVPAYVLVGTVCSRLLTKYGEDVSSMIDRATSIAAEGLSNIKLVQAYRAQYRLETIYAGYLRQMQKSASSQSGIEALQMGLLYFVSYAANALAIWWGSRDIARSLARNLPGTTIGSVYTVIFVLVDGKSTLFPRASLTCSSIIRHHTNSTSLQDLCRCDHRLQKPVVRNATYVSAGRNRTWGGHRTPISREDYRVQEPELQVSNPTSTARP